MTQLTIDWNQVWKEQMLKNIYSEGDRDCVGYWNNVSDAERYWHESQQHDFGRIRKTLQSLDVSKESRVLDIGAGPGVLTIPLAYRVRHVTAIEPSAAMMGVLRRNVDHFALRNVDSIQKRWEEVDVLEDLSPPYDLVVVSFALGMLDLENALKKMSRIASKRVCIYWFAGKPSWDFHFENLTKILHGIEYHPMPGCDILFNILYQMEIYPSLLMFPYTQARKFVSLDDAVEHYAPKYRVKRGWQKDVLREYLKKIIQREDGFYWMKHTATCVKVWWNQQADATLSKECTANWVENSFGQAPVINPTCEQNFLVS